MAARPKPVMFAMWRYFSPVRRARATRPLSSPYRVLMLNMGLWGLGWLGCCRVVPAGGNASPAGGGSRRHVSEAHPASGCVPWPGTPMLGLACVCGAGAASLTRVVVTWRVCRFGYRRNEPRRRASRLGVTVRRLLHRTVAWIRWRGWWWRPGHQPPLTGTNARQVGGPCASNAGRRHQHKPLEAAGQGRQGQRHAQPRIPKWSGAPSCVAKWRVPTPRSHGPARSEAQEPQVAVDTTSA